MNPVTHVPGENASSIIDTAAHAADNAIRSSQRLANQTLDQLAGQVEGARVVAGPALDGLAQDASRLAQRGSDALRRGGQQVRDQALHARDTTRDYIQQEPLKAVLFAAAAGAAIMFIGQMLGRRHAA